MTDPTPNRPLWKVMEDAFLKGRRPGFNNRFGYAAELRAIARQLTRKQTELLESGHAMSALAIEEWLYAEADRAEASGQ